MLVYHIEVVMDGMCRGKKEFDKENSDRKEYS
jgi:hypothetical protein